MKHLINYTVWKIGNVEVHNYGGDGYNVYLDDVKIDYFTLYSKESKVVNALISKRIKELGL